MRLSFFFVRFTIPLLQGVSDAAIKKTTAAVAMAAAGATRKAVKLPEMADPATLPGDSCRRPGNAGARKTAFRGTQIVKTAYRQQGNAAC